MKRDVQKVFEDVVQHLHHGGFPEAQICELTGMRPTDVRLAIVAVEKRRPKLCTDSCAGHAVLNRTPCALCPYCDHLLAIALPLAEAELLSRTPRARGLQ